MPSGRLGGACRLREREREREREMEREGEREGERERERERYKSIESEREGVLKRGTSQSVCDVQAAPLKLDLAWHFVVPFLFNAAATLLWFMGKQPNFSAAARRAYQEKRQTQKVPQGRSAAASRAETARRALEPPTDDECCLSLRKNAAVPTARLPDVAPSAKR